MVWANPSSVEEYVAFQLATLAFLLHKKGMKEPSQLLIGVRTELLSKLDETFRSEAEAAQEFHSFTHESTAPAK